MITESGGGGISPFWKVREGQQGQDSHSSGVTGSEVEGDSMEQ